MKTFLLGLIFVIASIGTAMGQTLAKADRETQKRTLVIHSSRRDAPYTALIERAYRKTLRDGLAERLDYYTEYVDLARFSSPEYQEALRDFLRRKYAGRRLDVIITEGNAPFEFVARHGAEIFPGAPLVFSIEERDLRPIPNSTGLVFQIDMKSTLDLALRLQPNIKRVFVISGASEFDKFYEEIARRQFQEYEGRVAFTYLPPMPLKDLLEEAPRLPENSIIYFVSLFEDGARNRFIPVDILDKLSPMASVPVYCWPEMTMDYGIVGGNLLSEENVARQTAELALRVLRGESPDQIPIAKIRPYINVFNWRQLRRWGISEDRLPPGSVIRFKEEPFWSHYKWRIIGVVSLCVGQGLLIFGLLIHRARRGRAEKALRESEELHRIVLSNISDAVFITDNKGDFTFVCPNVNVIFGHSFEETWALGHITRLLGKNLFPPHELAALGEIRNIEREITSKSGASRTLLVSVKRVSIKGGTALYVCRDITDLRESLDRIEDLAGRLIVAQEEERKYIARELHDDLNQQVSSLAIGLGKLKRQLPENGDSVLDQVAKLQYRATGLAAHIRRLSHNLHSTTLEHVGLAAALKAYCDEFTEQEGIAVTLRTEEELEAIPPDVALCLYRVAQEALRNIARHSGAGSAEVTLTGTGCALELRVADQGKGFDSKQSESRRGLGLASMEERVKLLRGSFDLRTQPGAGTELLAQIPLGA